MEVLIGIGKFIIDHSAELSGLLLPPVVDYLAQDIKQDNERYIFTILICILVAILSNWNQILYGSVAQVEASIGIIFLESQTIFKLYFKNSWVRYKIQSLYSGPLTTPIAPDVPMPATNVTP